MTSFASTLSAHPLATHAVGEVVGEIIERLDGLPDLAVLFVTAPHTGVLEDIAAAVDELLTPGVLIGATAAAVVGGNRELEDVAAISLWAARFPTGAGVHPGVHPVVLEAAPGPDGWRLDGWPPAELARGSSTLLLLADPFTFSLDAVFEHLDALNAPIAVVGGMASAARGPGGNRLVFGRRVLDRGAVGVLLDASIAPTAVVSQGCRPVGQPFTVTRSERNIVYELAGRPALERLMEVIDALSPEDRALVARGALHCGIVIDDRKVDFEAGDFLVRAVLGADRANGAVAVGDDVALGAAVQFQVRDAIAADTDLYDVLDGHHGDAALVFTCNGRGTQLFGEPDHDARAVSDLTGTRAVAGMACAGEFGPVGGRNALHTFTASVALFRG